MEFVVTLRDCLCAAGLRLDKPTEFIEAMIKTVHVQFPTYEWKKIPCLKSFLKFATTGSLPAGHMHSEIGFYLFCYHVTKVKLVCGLVSPEHLTTVFLVTPIPAVILPDWPGMHLEAFLDAKQIILDTEQPNSLDDPFMIEADPPAADLPAEASETLEPRKRKQQVQCSHPRKTKTTTAQQKARELEEQLAAAQKEIASLRDASLSSMNDSEYKLAIADLREQVIEQKQKAEAVKLNAKKEVKEMKERLKETEANCKKKLEELSGQLKETEADCETKLEELRGQHRLEKQDMEDEIVGLKARADYFKKKRDELLEDQEDYDMVEDKQLKSQTRFHADATRPTLRG